MAQQFKIEGLAELDVALTEMKKSTARGVLMRTLKKQGQIVADAGESFAPRRTGQLAESYTVGTKLSRRQKSKHKKESDVEVFVGPTPHAKSIQTEFGNAHQAAHPHLRPAWDGSVKSVLDGIRSDLAAEIEKTRARAAKRAERLAAKLKSGS